MPHTMSVIVAGRVIHQVKGTEEHATAVMQSLLKTYEASGHTVKASGGFFTVFSPEGRYVCSLTNQSALVF